MQSSKITIFESNPPSIHQPAPPPVSKPTSKPLPPIPSVFSQPKPSSPSIYTATPLKAFPFYAQTREPYLLPMKEDNTEAFSRDLSDAFFSTPTVTHVPTWIAEVVNNDFNAITAVDFDFDYRWVCKTKVKGGSEYKIKVLWTVVFHKGAGAAQYYDRALSEYTFFAGKPGKHVKKREMDNENMWRTYLVALSNILPTRAAFDPREPEGPFSRKQQQLLNADKILGLNVKDIASGQEDFELKVHVHNVKGIFALAVNSATTEFILLEPRKEAKAIKVVKNVAQRVPGGLEVTLLGLEAVDGFIEVAGLVGAAAGALGGLGSLG
ncbi:MAG: hypothetical protein Q8K75_04770 [Chlamydiales bacterium]|nr:hypothetical protein [Chlamydiales bacterium]